MNDDILKDVILSTLAEIEEDDEVIEESVEENIRESDNFAKEDTPLNLFQDSPTLDISIEEPQKRMEKIEPLEKVSTVNVSQNSGDFLISIRERIATLFEGLKSEKMKNRDKKLDITLKYLEYLLISIDEKLKK